jgi:hypothetical protein
VTVAFTKQPLLWAEILPLVAFALLMVYRGRDTRKTFADEISHYIKAAKHPPTPSTAARFSKPDSHDRERN